jgi:hypothetical protein
MTATLKSKLVCLVLLLVLIVVGFFCLRPAFGPTGVFSTFDNSTNAPSSPKP